MYLSKNASHFDIPFPKAFRARFATKIYKSDGQIRCIKYSCYFFHQTFNFGRKTHQNTPRMIKKSKFMICKAIFTMISNWLESGKFTDFYSKKSYLNISFSPWGLYILGRMVYEPPPSPNPP